MCVYQRLLMTAGVLLLAGIITEPPAFADASRLLSPAELSPSVVTATYTGDTVTIYLRPTPYPAPAIC